MGDLSQQSFKNAQQRPQRRLDRWEQDEIQRAKRDFSRWIWVCAFCVVLGVIGINLWASLVPSGPPTYNMPYSVRR